MNSQELELLRLRISNLKRKLKTEPTTALERQQRPWDKLHLSRYERELVTANRNLIVETPRVITNRIKRIEEALERPMLTAAARRQYPLLQTDLKRYKHRLAESLAADEKKKEWKSALVRLKAMEKQRIADQSANDQAAN